MERFFLLLVMLCFVLLNEPHSRVVLCLQEQKARGPHLSLLHPVLLTSHCGDHTLTNLRKEGFILVPGLRRKPTVAGRQDSRSGGSGHIASTVRKQNRPPQVPCPEASPPAQRASTATTWGLSGPTHKPMRASPTLHSTHNPMRASPL